MSAIFSQSLDDVGDGLFSNWNLVGPGPKAQSMEFAKEFPRAFDTALSGSILHLRWGMVA
jgi:hypothetical protein